MRPLLLVLVALSLIHAAVGEVSKTSSIAYYGVYLRGNKIGRMISLRDPKSQWEGKPAVRTETTMELSLNVLEQTTRIISRNITWNDPSTGVPLASENRTESGGSVTRVTATYTPQSVSYVADVTGTVTRDVLRLKPGERFMADALNANAMPRSGMRYRGKVFLGDPAALQLLDSEIEILNREPVDVGGRMVTAYRVLDKNPIAPTTLYLSDSGEMLRADLPLGMQLRKESKEVAFAPAASGPVVDFLDLTAIKPQGVSLENPRSLRRARYKLEIVSKSPSESSSTGGLHALPSGDGIQTVTFEGECASRAAIITVQNSSLPQAMTARLFSAASGQSAPPERLRPFLKASVQVSSDAPEFVALAKAVIGDEKETARAAAKIAAYVHKKISPDPAITSVRTAKDILRDPRGVCRDYTLFFTAIARAAGLPTRQRLGLVYAEGRFYGHAWPEVWTGTNPEGTDQWTALEPTWGKPFADATHIALAEGEITDFVKVVNDLMRYRITVLEVSEIEARETKTELKAQ